MILYKEEILEYSFVCMDHNTNKYTLDDGPNIFPSPPTGGSSISAQPDRNQTNDTDTEYCYVDPNKISNIMAKYNAEKKAETAESAYQYATFGEADSNVAGHNPQVLRPPTDANPAFTNGNPEMKPDRFTGQESGQPKDVYSIVTKPKNDAPQTPSATVEEAEYSEYAAPPSVPPKMPGWQGDIMH
jgi:hypothetical protein